MINSITYDSLNDFVNAISYKGELYDTFSKGFIFRGMSSSKFELVPNALRKENENNLWALSNIQSAKEPLECCQIENEYRIIKKFYKGCDKNSLPVPNIDRIRDFMATDIGVDLVYYPGEKWLPHDLYEIAALAQHYGLPTRLLDWSKSIYTALYFAAIGNISEKGKDDYMVLWAFNVLRLCWCDFPLKIINPSYYRNPNLGAQQGLFTLWEIDKPIKSYKPFYGDEKRKIDRRALNDLIADYFAKNANDLYLDNLFYKIQIPAVDSVELLKYLRILGYDSSKLFPGYSGIVKDIKDISLETIEF